MTLRPDMQIWVDLLSGAKIGTYKVGQFRGGGEFGLVFEAESENGKLIALKILVPAGAPSNASLEFDREGQLLKKLTRASNVVKLVESDVTQIIVSMDNGIKLPIGIQFHALEIASGNLEEIIVANADIPWSERLTLWRGIVLGVHQMHINQIVHRDLKSSNCLLFVKEKRQTDCKVADLGRARDLTQAAIEAPDNYFIGRGDLRFASPENLTFQGSDSPQAHRLSDLYGLGSLLFELATGQCITALALGFGPTIVSQSQRLRQLGQSVDLSSFRSNYDQAISVFEEQIPKSFRKPATEVVRQLCSPVPLERLPRLGLGRRASPDAALEWLIRKVDILISCESSARPHQKTLVHR